MNRMYKVYDPKGPGTNPGNVFKNIVVYSAITKIETKVPFNNFGIKYVLNGLESYHVNGRTFNLNAGDYLLCNAKAEGNIFVDSKEAVEGICIDISQDLLSEVVASHRRPDTWTPDLNLDSYFMTGSFMEFQQHDSKTQLGKMLHNLGNIIQENPHADYLFYNEFYYKLAEHVVADCMPIYKQLQSIGSIKIGTKKELYKRLSIGKEFMDQYFACHIGIDQVAKEAQISQYHFFRLFKNVYGISPYQYIKQKRMILAKEYVDRKEMTISEIAQEIGYSDIFSMSKAYKQYYGFAPSGI